MSCMDSARMDFAYRPRTPGFDGLSSCSLTAMATELGPTALVPPRALSSASPAVGVGTMYAYWGVGVGAMLGGNLPHRCERWVHVGHDRAS